MPSPAAILNIVITANAAAAQANIAKTEAQMKSLAATSNSSAMATAGAWQKAGQRMSSIGKTLTRTVTLPAAAVGAVSVKMAMDFDTSMMKIQNLAGTSEATMKRFREEILRLAPAVGKSPQELADALYFIRSSGIKAADSMEVLTVTAKASAIGLGSTVTVADAVTSAMNAYRRSNLSAADATNTLAKAVQYGKGEPEELAKSIGRVIPVASKLKVPFNDVGASLAGLTLQGLDAAEATTALRAVFLAVLKPGSQAADELKSVGLTAEGLRQTLAERGTLAMLNQVSTAFKGNEEAMARVFPNVRGLVGAFNLTGDSAKRNAQIFAAMKQNTDLVGIGFQKLTKTEAFKLHQTLAALQASAIKLGESLLPVVNDLARVIAALAAGFSSMPKFARDLLLGAIVLGPLIRMVGLVLQLAGAWKAVAAAQAASGIAGAAGGAGGAAGILGKLGLAARVAAGGVMALTAAYIAYKGASEAIKTRHEDIVGPGGDLAKAQLNEAAFEKIIAQYKASEQGLTTSRAHQVAVRIMQMAKEGKVSAQWAADHIKAMRNAEAATHPFQNAMSTMGAIVRKNFAGLGKTAQFEMRKVMDAILHGRDPVQALGASFGNLENKISRAMNQGKISVEKGTKMINSLIAQERAMLGLPPIAGGAFTLPSQQHGPKTGRGGGQAGVHRQKGGFLPGPSQGDRIPLLAEGGEFMVNAKATKKFLPLLQRINDAVPRFAKGGQLANLKFSGTGPGNIDDMAAAALNLEADWARKYVAKLAPRGAAGAGKMRHYAHLSGDTDFSIALGMALSRMAGAAGTNISVTSGFRSVAEQAALYKANPNPMMVAPPGRSHHGLGIAADISPGRSVFGGMAAKFGLRFPMSWEPWHIELAKYQRGGQIFGNRLNIDQLTTLAKYVGARNPAVMAAIAMAESTGNPRAMGGAGDKGLWQIIPSTARNFGIPYGPLFDPIKNARGMAKIAFTGGNGNRPQGLSAWSTYNSGAYRKFLGGHVKPGLLAQLRGNGTGGTAPGLKGTLKGAKPKATQPGLLGGLKGAIDREALLESMQAAVEAENVRRGNINELRAAQNLLALQRYQTGAAQNPLLGIPSPAMPVLAEMLGMQPEAFLYAQRTAPVRSGKAKKGYGFGAGIVGQAQPPPVHVHVHARKGAPDFTSWLDVQIEKKQKKAAKLGRRRLPSAGAR